MGMTMTQKILAAHAGLDSVVPGQLIEANIDLALANDITGPVAIRELKKADMDKVFDRTKVALVMDHFAPNKDIKSAEQCKECRDFARKHDIVNFFDVGRMGVEHALLPEQGIVASGDVIIGADSHTCTYGALGAFSTGVGSTDCAAGIATGKAWFRVPSAIKFNLTGKLQGEGIASLSMDDRFSIANMAIEAGAKNGIFPVDEKTIEYMKGRAQHEPVVFSADDDAEYERVIDIDLSTIPSTVAAPHLPENTKPVTEFADVKIDQAVIGSCTNGRIEDMRIAAEILKGRKVADGVRAIVMPATQEVELQCIREGLAEIFIEAGAIISTPTCGPCLGGHMGILAAGERAISTTNRNFVGRMGHVESEVYLSSPAVAAASAITGYITDPASL